MHFFHREEIHTIVGAVSDQPSAMYVDAREMPVAACPRIEWGITSGDVSNSLTNLEQ